MISYGTPALADGPALDAMAKESWIATFGHSCSPEDAATFLGQAYGPGGNLIRDLSDPAIRWRVARDARAIAGYAKLTPAWLPGSPADALQLSQLYVASAWHGTGVAATLMEWTVDTARLAGAAQLLLTVWEHNSRAQRFYTRHGFEHIGDYAFPVGQQVDRDLVLRKWL